ncbi:hypothetical protein [Aminivibrio sp.]|uniref:hypothetical protein n=1 Tax=Aminivibrio sp. TaxID=1872489 RepID=UPI001A43F11F|nr:hypothetical protein [Aminivibrio sp.]MBL3540202.1 hypothetical protein [Aminivibrio sp.]
MSRYRNMFGATGIPGLSGVGLASWPESRRIAVLCGNGGQWPGRRRTTKILKGGLQGPR